MCVFFGGENFEQRGFEQFQGFFTVNTTNATTNVTTSSIVLQTSCVSNNGLSLQGYTDPNCDTFELSPTAHATSAPPASRSRTARV